MAIGFGYCRTGFDIAQTSQNRYDNATYFNNLRLEQGQ